MQKIHAWVRDPANNFFKGQSKHCHFGELFCENPNGCDLYTKDNSCILCGFTDRCKFGNKRVTEGPTRRARNFYTAIKKFEDENGAHLKRLSGLHAYNRIFLTNGFYYLPYSFMKGCKGSPIAGGLFSKGEFVSVDDMTPELLEKICTALPMAMFGGVIDSYQKDEVPKFISDLQRHYPHLFDMLSDKQKERIKSVNYVGRTADIATCPPCEFVISRNKWKWDGEFLTGHVMLFQPVDGEIEIRIRPKKGASVKITANTQVNENTRFLD